MRDYSEISKEYDYSVNLLQDDNIVEYNGVPSGFNLDGDFFVFAASVQGSAGNTWYISGFGYEVQADIVFPEVFQYSFKEIVPMRRYMSSSDAIAEAESYFYDDPSHFFDIVSGDCSDLYFLCLQNALEKRNLERANAGVPWTGITAGGGTGAAVVGGIAGILGAETGPFDAAIASVGAFFGSIVGGITGGLVEHANDMGNAERTLDARVRFCGRALEWCTSHGNQWPDWAQGALGSP